MEYEIAKKGDSLIARLTGSLTFKNTKEFGVVIEEFNAQNAKALELDFAELTFIDSTGLGALVRAFDATQVAKGDFIIHNASGSVLQALERSKFGKIAKLI